MIQSFANKELENFFLNDKVPRNIGWANIHRVVRRKLFALDAAHRLSDLKAPPGNQLEALKDDLLGYHSIRVNDQWRIIFIWPPSDQGATDVDVVDYH